MLNAFYFCQHRVVCCYTVFSMIVIAVKPLMNMRYKRLTEKWVVSGDGKHKMVNLSLLQFIH